MSDGKLHADPEQDLIHEWLRDEAMNMDKILTGERRLGFRAWKSRRDELARTGRGGIS